MIAITVKVRDAGGAYTTCTIGRKRASSTCSAETAAQRLAEKLFGGSVQSVEPADKGPGCTDRAVTWWRVVVGDPVPQT